MKKFLFIFSIVVVEIGYLYLWRICYTFKFILPLSSERMTLQLDDVIHNDEGSLLLIRFFHNKISLVVFEIIKKYFLLWDTRLIVDISSFFSLLGIIFALWYLLPLGKGRKRIFLFLLVLPIFVIFLPASFFKTSLSILFITYCGLSLIGWWLFMHTSKKITFQAFFWITMIISLCYFFVFLHSTPYFCLK